MDLSKKKISILEMGPPDAYPLPGATGIEDDFMPVNNRTASTML